MFYLTLLEALSNRIIISPILFSLFIFLLNLVETDNILLDHNLMYGGGLYSINTYPKREREREREREELYIEVEFRTIGTQVQNYMQQVWLMQFEGLI